MLRPTTIAALERIQYQHGSPLYRKILEATAVALDHIRSTAPRDAQGRAAICSDARLRSICQWLTKNYAPLLQTAARDELHLKIKSVDIIPARFINAYMWPEFESKTLTYGDLLAAFDTFSGLSAAGGDLPKRARELFTLISGDVDPHTGKLGAKAAEVYSISLGLYAGLFLGEEMFAGIEPFTAGEITAVIMHEIGHGITMAEQVGWTHHRATVIADSIRYIAENLKPNDVKPILAVIQAEAAQIPDAAERKRVERVVNGFIDILAASLPLKVLQAISNTLIIVIIVTALTMLVSMLVRAWDLSLASLSGRKTSDQIKTQKNRTHIERIADEFVARHGGSGDLAAALVKIHTFFEKGYVFGALDHFKPLSVLLQTVSAQLQVIAAIFDTHGEAVVSGYDLILHRLRLTVQNNMTAFKDPRMPPEARQAMIASTEQALKAIAEYEGRTYVQLREFIWGTLIRMTKPGTVIGALVDGNLAADYTKLQALSEHLIRTPLFYHAARLQELQARK